VNAVPEPEQHCVGERTSIREKEEDMSRWKSATVLALLLALCTMIGCTRAPETGRLQFIAVDDQTMDKLGAEAFQEVKTEEKIYRGPEINGIVRRVGTRIAEASDRTDYDWEFVVIDDPDVVNAFALPGGKVAVYTGILPVAGTEGGLAVVLGHEIAHVVARHGAEQLTQQMGTAMILEAASVGLSGNENHDLIMAGLGVGTTVGVLLPYSRTQESEADEIGIMYMARAGYDPREAPRFWERMSELGDGGRPPEFLSTHPDPEKREEELQKWAGRAMSEYENSPEYGLGGKIPPVK
jgi:predicted Zn-dependent protease